MCKLKMKQNTYFFFSSLCHKGKKLNILAFGSILVISAVSSFGVSIVSFGRCTWQCHNRSPFLSVLASFDYLVNFETTGAGDIFNEWCRRSASISPHFHLALKNTWHEISFSVSKGMTGISQLSLTCNNQYPPDHPKRIHNIFVRRFICPSHS